MLLAVGVILTGPHTCRLRRGDAKQHNVEFRCIVSAAYDTPGTRLLRAPCADGRAVKQTSCACKTFFWFTRAPSLFPHASFIAKVEDDTIVHYDALLTVLDAIPRHQTYVWMDESLPVGDAGPEVVRRAFLRHRRRLRSL